MPAQLAQALYDNAAESPEELSFRRGDVMLVLERDAQTLGGWWRCSLGGKQGIAPGNRLQLLPEENTQENEYQAPRLIGATAVTPKLQKYEVMLQNSTEEQQSEVYQVPSIARLCIATPQDEIYNSPRHIETSQPCPQEVYDKPSSLLRDIQSASETYDSPVLRVKDVAAQPTEEIPEDIYDVPPMFQNVPLSDNEEDEGIYSLPSNLKRVSGLQNLYEAPEDILSCGNVPETLEPPQTHRLSISSTGSARSADSGGSRESGLPSVLSRDPRSDGVSTMESLRLLHQELQRTAVLMFEKMQESSGQGCLDYQVTAQVVEALKDFVGLAQVVLLHSCQASDPSLHRQLSGHLEKLELALLALQEANIELSVVNGIQEQSGFIVALVSANAGLLFPRPRLSSSESLSRRPLPALPTASPATHRKGSIQDRPLPPPPIMHCTPTDSGEDAHSEYERIQCRDNHYVHLQGTVTTQTMQKSKDRPTDIDQRNSQEKKADPCPEPSEEDRHLLRFYASQSHGHLQTLETCMGTFLGSASSQPPRIFVGHGKQLVIAAHKLVFIGDTLGRLLSCTQLQVKLAGEGGTLCQALKEVVIATKEAAALYPSPVALKAMAASVSVLCTCAHSFTELLQKLSAA
ncbi:embryonal Fyn-associated substrate isoform X2 [Rana temporaria]|uniref:embryonal Fyn-associated substrate isoform X2 n=1 Tax=Rana temporaria TaxID=8407 RepID=UPI001AAD2007|nr:embryonal Fyn-associated substrate isoform X2 [Rana temporaria]